MLRKTTKTRKHLYIYIYIYQEHSLRRFLLFHSLSWIDWIPVAGYMLSQGYPPYVIMYSTTYKHQVHPVRTFHERMHQQSYTL
jgi:hypothetical protein